MDEEYYEERVLSILRGRHGWDEEYSSISELKQHLNEEAALAEEKLRYGWVLWRPNDSTQLQHKIITLLNHMASTLEFRYHYLVQFWAVVGGEERQHHSLTASNQPFCVGDLKKGLCWYRKLCMDHVYRVGEEAEAEQLGGVGRAYRNKHPESTPDLMLYSAAEFPLRDAAARCGLRAYLALPLFDLHNNQCCGVLELLSGYTTMRRSLLSSLNRGLQIAELRSTHINFIAISRNMTGSKPESEITKILELAIKAVPQVLLAQVWVPCKQCTDISSKLRCMERESFMDAYNKKVNLYDGIDDSMLDYLQACEFHYLQVDFSYLGQNLCDLSICKNPLAHYISKTRLSLRFAVCLKSEDSINNDHYIIEFFLQPNSSLDLLSSIMDTKLKSFEVVSGGLVHSRKPNVSESCEFTDYIVDEMNSCKEIFSELNFIKYLETVDLCCLRPSYLGSDEGWVFWHSKGEGMLSENGINSNSLMAKEKIQHFMKKIAVKKTHYDWIVQFWEPKMVEDRYCLETSDQPFAVGSLAKGLASFRKKCMQHHYFVDDKAKEDELGPPGRVFRNGHPEITPDHFLYTAKEFPIRNHAMHCCRRGYFALPLFDAKHNHTCFGVLEFVGFSYSELEDIGRALEAAKLKSTHHIHFRQRFIANHESANITNGKKSALAEVNEAFSVIIEIPQFQMAKLWVPFEKCANNARGMVLASSIMDLCNDMPTTKLVRQIHVQPRKGIIGMVMASESKSCFCRNLYEFGIADQPLAHYERRERRDVCFAMCLQSSHTGELLYVIEFFLYQGPATYDYLRSFLNFLLPIMEFELKSFKFASGKQFGDELVVEVIEFSEENQLAFHESNLLDVIPIKFKSVMYGQKEHQDSADQQVQSGSNATLAEHTNVAASEFEKTSRGKRKTGLHLSLEVLQPLFGKKLNDVAEELGVGRSTIKRACRDYGIDRWPYKVKQTRNPSLFERRSNLQNVSHTNTERVQPLIVQEETEKVIVKVRYEGDTIRFKLCLSLGVGKLFDEVSMRLNLKRGAFKLKYLDEDNEEILLACDDDLRLCPKSRTLTGKTCIQLFLQLIGK